MRGERSASTRMLTLTDINRALDRLGVEAFLPRTRREVAGSLLTSSRRTAPAATLPGRHRPGSIYGRPYGFREQVQDSTNAPCLAAIEAGPGMVARSRSVRPGSPNCCGTVRRRRRGPA